MRSTIKAHVEDLISGIEEGLSFDDAARAAAVPRDMAEAFRAEVRAGVLRTVDAIAERTGTTRALVLAALCRGYSDT